MQVIIPMSPLIHTIPAVDRAFSNPPAPQTDDTSQPATFIDSLKQVWDEAAQAQAAKNEDMANIMLGDTDSLESLQINIAKAEIATELLVNIKNSIVDAYNELVRMSI